MSSNFSEASKGNAVCDCEMDVYVGYMCIQIVYVKIQDFVKLCIGMKLKLCIF